MVAIGSVASVKGTAGFGTYGATKAAVRNLVRTWTMELKDRRIRSNVLSPGPTTRRCGERHRGIHFEASGHDHPDGTYGRAGRSCEYAVFLASDDPVL